MRLIRIHPQLARVMVAEFPGHHFWSGGDVSLLYGGPPFSRRSSTGHFCRFSDAATLLLQLHGQARP